MNSDVKELGGRDPHALLGLQPGASQEEVVRAFRRSATKEHPDVGGDDQTFRQLARAREILLDPSRLTAYNVAAGTAPPVESFRTRRYGPPPTSSSHDWPRAARGQQPDAGTPAAQADPPMPSVPTAPPTLNVLAIIAVALVLLGPLLWPVAIGAGLLTLLMSKRAGPSG